MRWILPAVLLQYCGQMFMYAIATGRAERNPAADLKGALKTHVKKHFAHLKAIELPRFLKSWTRMMAICKRSWL